MCVYHPIDKFRVVEDDEGQKLIATGVWFKCPKLAADYRAKVEQDIQDETPTAKKVKPKKSTEKVKERLQ